MYCCGFEKVVVDFVEICDRSNDMRPDVSLLAECLHPPPYPAVAVFDELGFLRVEAFHFVLICSLAIDPLLHFDNARAVVHFVGDVGGLFRYTTDLTHKADLGDFVTINLEFGVWVWLVGVEGLLDSDWADGVFAV